MQEETKQILVSISAMQANIENIGKKVDEISAMSTVVIQTDQSVKRAHERIDAMGRETEKQFTELKTDFKEKLSDQKIDLLEDMAADRKNFERMQNNQTWLVRSVALLAITYVANEIFKLI